VLKVFDNKKREIYMKKLSVVLGENSNTFEFSKWKFAGMQ